MLATDLDQRISQLLAEWAERPFAWGQTDCCQFARAAFLKIHGVDLIPPAYTTEKQALRALKALGGYAGLLSSNKLQQRPILAARRGDFLIIAHKAAGFFDAGLAVCTGLQAHSTTKRGLIEVGREHWQECWGVAENA